MLIEQQIAQLGFFNNPVSTANPGVNHAVETTALPGECNLFLIMHIYFGQLYIKGKHFFAGNF
ncbi:hypothetical protein KKB99_04350, partial [bacterium]|nr:hypothetical protein [bacterium]MBU1025225.1 hypothetical protein [bacterium]